MVKEKDMEEDLSREDSLQVLTFCLQDDIFAIDITKVREVIEYSRITNVPHMPEFMLGAINLRGMVIPVIDMRLKFGMPKGEITVNTCIIIVEVDTGSTGGKTIIGALVDSVKEVVTFEPERLSEPPDIGMHLKPDFIKAMGNEGDSFVIILDIDKVFSSEELLTISLPQNKEEGVEKND